MVKIKELQMDLRAHNRTLWYIGISFITGGLYAFYWTMSLIKGITEGNQRYSMENLNILSAAFIFLLLSLFGEALIYIIFRSQNLMLIFKPVVLCFFLVVHCMLSVKLSKLLRQFSAQSDAKLAPKAVWAILFGSIYFYYIIHNATESEASAAPGGHTSEQGSLAN